MEEKIEELVNRIFSIEDGFQIVMLFLTDFWFKFLKQNMIEKDLINEKFKSKMNSEASSEEQYKSSLHDRNDYFFVTVCDGTSSGYFEKVIEGRLKIPPVKQSGIKVEEELLFQLMLDFCEFDNQRCSVTMEESLRFAINCLEEMRKHPDKHKVEWKIWNDVVINVTEHGARSMGFF